MDAGGCSGAREPAVPGWMGGCLERRQATGRSESAMCSFFVCSCVGVRPPTLADLFFDLVRYGGTVFVTGVRTLASFVGVPKKTVCCACASSSKQQQQQRKKIVRCRATTLDPTHPTPASGLPGIGPTWHRPFLASALPLTLSRLAADPQNRTTVC